MPVVIMVKSPVAPRLVHIQQRQGAADGVRCREQTVRRSKPHMHVLFAQRLSLYRSVPSCDEIKRREPRQHDGSNGFRRIAAPCLTSIHDLALHNKGFVFDYRVVAHRDTVMDHALITDSAAFPEDDIVCLEDTFFK